jgi:hypothetical protein
VNNPGMLYLYGNCLRRAMVELFPEYPWKEWEFKVGQKSFDLANFKNQKKYFRFEIFPEFSVDICKDG